MLDVNIHGSNSWNKRIEWVTRLETRRVAVSDLQAGLKIRISLPPAAEAHVHLLGPTVATEKSSYWDFCRVQSFIVTIRSSDPRDASTIATKLSNHAFWQDCQML